MIPRRTAGALSLLVAMAASVVACGEPPALTPPATPSEASTQSPTSPSVEPAEKAPAEAGALIPSDGVAGWRQDWCGTDRADLGERVLDEGGAPPVGTEVLIKHLTGNDVRVVRKSANALGMRGAAEATAALIKLRESHTDPLVRFEAASALRKLPGVDVIPALIDALEDDNSLVRLTAWEGLRREAVLLDPSREEDEDVGARHRAIRRRLLDAKQPDLDRSWETWWRDNEPALRKRRHRSK